MVFKILRAMVNNGFDVNDGLDDPLSLKSAYGWDEASLVCNCNARQ